MVNKTIKPHMQRCETCNNTTSNHIDCEWFKICNITGERIWSHQSLLTAKVGCSSHSNDIAGRWKKLALQLGGALMCVERLDNTQEFLDYIWDGIIPEAKSEIKSIEEQEQL